MSLRLMPDSAGKDLLSHEVYAPVTALLHHTM